MTENLKGGPLTNPDRPPTPHEELVWGYVRKIPVGRVLQYGHVGEALGLHPRQIGRALKRCPHDVPWWRVVDSGWNIRVLGTLRPVQLILLEDEGVKIDITIRPKYRGKP